MGSLLSTAEDTDGALAAYRMAVEARLKDNRGCGILEVLVVGFVLVLFTWIHRGVALYLQPHNAHRCALLQFVVVCIPMLVPYMGYTNIAVIVLLCLLTVIATWLSGRCVINIPPLFIFTNSAAPIPVGALHLHKRSGSSSLTKDVLSGSAVIQLTPPASPAAKLPASSTNATTATNPVAVYVPYVTTYRALLMLSTCFCILACDFDVLFPRRFLKTETFGIAVMDIGVGCFVFSAGYVSRKSLKIGSIVPLLCLGFIRLFMVKGVGYHEHESEYGKHWNFFFTLAAMPILCTTVIPNSESALVGVFLYQVALKYGGLGDFIQHADRNDLFLANREGILSSIGYAALYHAGKAVRQWIEAHRNGAGLVLGILLLFVAQLLDLFVQPISRRMCNMAYVVFIISFNVLQISLLRITDGLLPMTADESRRYDVIYHAVNRNAMFLFLLGNILTGAINVVTQPLRATLGVAVGTTMGFHMGILCLVSFVLHSYFDFTMKGW